MYDRDIKEIMSHFRIYGDYVKSDTLGNGHINSTFKVLFNQGGTIIPYALQKINTNIFKDPHKLTDNIVKITTYQKEYYKKFKDTSRRCLTPIQTNDGKYYYIDADRHFWRVFFCIESAVSYEIVRDAKSAYDTARAFGEFQKSLFGLKSASLAETIPDFHNTPKRFEAFEKAVKSDTAGRCKEVAKEIDFAFARKEKSASLIDMNKKGMIPERIVHNDTKLNNILFDIQTDEPICVLDLDLVMPGFSAYDFGDMIRTMTTPVAEDETDISKVEMRFDYFEAITEGFLSSARGFLTNGEIESLPYGGYVITFEQGIRFLTDYLNGDTYYKIHRPKHNLDRTRTQFALISSIEKQWDKMCIFINKL